MEAIILGNPYTTTYGEVTPITIPAVSASQAVIPLATGYTPYELGGTGASNSNNVLVNNYIINIFTITNSSTTTLNLTLLPSDVITILTVNGIEFYQGIDFNVSGQVITFVNNLPYDGTMENTIVKVVYPQSTTITTSTLGTSVFIDDSVFTRNLAGLGINNVQLLANYIDQMVSSGGSSSNNTFTYILPFILG
jgi:hypothetical protein